MLKRLRLVNFKGHRDSLVAFERLSLLAGENASGKSSVLLALEMLADVARGVSPWTGARQPERLVHRSRGAQPDTLEAKAELPGGWFGLDAGARRWRILAPGRPTMERTFGAAFGPQQGAGALAGLAALQPVVSVLRAPSYTRDLVPKVGRDGANTASVVAEIQRARDGRYEALLNDLRAVVPAVVGVSAVPAHVTEQVTEQRTLDGREATISFDHPVKGERLQFEFRGGVHSDAHGASEGTLIALAILAAVHGEAPPKVLLIDDIDRGLHPRAQVELVAVLKRLLDQRPELQVIATTHSPYLVDAVDAASVHVCAVDADGVCKVRRLTDHPEAHEALESLTPGEFLSAEGEAWVLDA